MIKNCLPLITAAFLLGCGSNDAPKDDSALRAELNKKEIDYAATPPAQRPQILAAMRANGAAAKAAELEKQWGMSK